MYINPKYIYKPTAMTTTHEHKIQKYAYPVSPSRTGGSESGIQPYVNSIYNIHM